MELEKQVCNLELAKKLKELGIKQESLFYWNEGININDEQEEVNHICLLNHNQTFSHWKFYSAFTIAELGEFLPKQIKSSNQTGFLFYDFEAEELSYICLGHNEYGNYRYPLVLNSQQLIFDGKEEVNSRAKALIYLIENDLIKVEDLK
jgi:hypothetical protein